MKTRIALEVRYSSLVEMFHKIKLNNRILEFLEIALRLLEKDCTSLSIALLEMYISRTIKYRKIHLLVIKMIKASTGLLTPYMNKEFTRIEIYQF